MRGQYIGKIEDKLFFMQLPKVKDAIAKGLDEESELLAHFLSEWNSLMSAGSLLESLYTIKNKDDSHEEVAELIRCGIYNEFNKIFMLFNEKGVIVSSDNVRSDVISLDVVISIVENWKLYLTIIKNEDAVFYGGKFFLNPKAEVEIRGFYN